MDSHIWLIGLSFMLCMTLSAAFFAFLVKKDFLFEHLMTASISVISAVFITVGLIASFWWYPYDFVSDITLSKFWLSFASFLIVLLFLFIGQARFLVLGIFFASCLCVFGADLYISFLPPEYTLLNKFLSIAALCVYSMGFRSLSGVNAYAQIQGIVICGGLTILCLFGQAPFILGVSSAGALGAMIMAYFCCKEQPLGPQNAPCIGFLMGWLGLLSAQEYLEPCFAIFSMLYLIELIVCLIRKLTFFQKYKDIAYNSIMLQALTNGLPAVEVVKHIFNINILLLIVGVIQIAGSSPYSLVAFAAIVTIWQLYRTVNWQQETKTFKEANQELKEQIAETFKKITEKKATKPKSKKRTKEKK